MSGMFVPGSEVARERPDWGSMAWCCRPKGTGMEKGVVIEVPLSPGGGHAFHKHPRQEEVIYCLEGRVEQWLDQECRVLEPGDCVLIPTDVVHASFNAGAGNAKVLAIIGPSVNADSGYEVEEVAGQEPWNGLR
jgi:quercetin dioxygenase-like cupin family protein